MQRLLDRLNGYSISNVLDDYCSDLRKVETEEGLCPHQPISRYESDFVSVTSSKELLSLYRKDFIAHVVEELVTKEIVAAAWKSGAKNTASFDMKTTPYGDTSKLVDEMRMKFCNDDKTKLDNMELLAKLDIYLDKIDRCKRGYSELSKSIPLSAYSAFKEKLSVKDNTLTQNVSIVNNNIKSEIKQPIKRRGGCKRKLVRSHSVN